MTRMTFASRVWGTVTVSRVSRGVPADRVSLWMRAAGSYRSAVTWVAEHNATQARTGGITVANAPDRHCRANMEKAHSAALGTM